MTQVCCPRCIGDSTFEAKPNVWRLGSPRACAYCSTKTRKTSAPDELVDAFLWLEDVYQPVHRDDPDGAPLLDRLREDWELFSAPADAAGTQLVARIAPSLGPRVRLIEPANAGHLWKTFKDSLQRRNRFFASELLKLQELAAIIGYIAQSISSESIWYRARIHPAERLQPSELGAPPEEFTSEGRANPRGIACLYLAGTSNTALCEVRPHPGHRVHVGRFRLNRRLVIADLTKVTDRLSPFLIQERKGLLAARQFFTQVASDLSQPVRPGDGWREYLPTQFICEWIKSLNFDGVRFRSAVADGDNLVLFDPQQARLVGRSKAYTVRHVRFQTDPDL